MLNKVMIIGRLGRDPELRYSQSGSPVCTLNIATDESYTDRDGNRVDRAEWPRVVVFQKAAENCSQYLTKGSKPANGRISRGRTATPPKSRPSASSSSTSAAANRAVCPAARAAAKAATALPVAPLSPEAATVPSSARSSGRTITKIWARRFLPRPAAWTTCRSRKILGRERVTGWRPFSSPNLPARLAPSLSPPKTFDWWGGRAEGVRSDVRLGETGFPCLTQR